VIGVASQRDAMTQGTVKDEPLDVLMREAQAGDTRAYAQLLKEIAPRLRSFLRGQRRFLGEEDIEDLLQDVLLSLHAVRATYDPGRPFMPWLMAIARNRLADSGRRYARRSAHEVQVDELPVTVFDGAADIDAEIYGNPEELRKAIQALPRGQRQAIEMLKLREMSLKEASAASGTSAGALKVSVSRAMGALRKALVKE
jgi:RNA polymerase sigma factor (sigma-70 family)